MKHLAILLLSTFTGQMLHAQPVASLSINKSLEIVIRSISGEGADMKGAEISRDGQTTRFQSNLLLPGLPSGIIEERRQGSSTISWKTVLHSSNSRTEAFNKYRDLFNSLNNSIIKSASEKPFIVSGRYKQPSDDNTIMDFELLPAAEELKELKLQLIIEKSDDDYIIFLQVCR